MNKNLVEFKSFLMLLFAIIFIASCNSDNGNDDSENDATQVNGLYVLCEGVYGQNNSALSVFSFTDSTLASDYFSVVNKTGLGETANDMLVVDNDLYVVVSGSASIMVLNKNTAELRKIISIIDTNGVNRQPRHIAYYNGYVYVSCFDGNVLKISTKTKEIVSVLSTGGRNPEGLAVAAGKLYVANSGGLSYPNYDNTVSVINLLNFTVDTLLTVYSNPQLVKAYNNKAYVLSQGDYSSTSVLTVIDDLNIKETFKTYMTDFEPYNGKIYYIYKSYKDNKITLNTISATSLNGSMATFTAAPTDMVSPYHINAMDGVIYITDAKDYATSGSVFAFNTSGELLYSFQTAVNPNKVIKNVPAIAKIQYLMANY